MLAHSVLGKQDEKKPINGLLFVPKYAKIQFLPIFSKANIHDIIKKDAIIEFEERIL